MSSRAKRVGLLGAAAGVVAAGAAVVLAVDRSGSRRRSDPAGSGGAANVAGRPQWPGGRR